MPHPPWPLPPVPELSTLVSPLLPDSLEPSLAVVLEELALDAVVALVTSLAFDVSPLSSSSSPVLMMQAVANRAATSGSTETVFDMGLLSKLGRRGEVVVRRGGAAAIHPIESA